MVDGVAPINPALVAAPVVTPTAINVQLTNLPPELAALKQISGQIVAVDGKNVTLQTPQGLVNFTSDTPLQVGLEILLKLAPPATNASQNTPINLAQLLILSDKTADPSVVKPTVPDLPAVTVAPTAQNTADANFLQTAKTLPITITTLPQTLGAPATTLLIKQIIGQATLQNLPPPLQEALAKIAELTTQLKPVSLGLPSTTPQAVTPLTEPQILEQVLNMITGKVSSPPATNKPSMPQLLQVIPPGTQITSQMLEQIIPNLQASQNTPVLALLLTPTPTTPATNNVPQLISLLQLPQANNTTPTQALGLINLPPNAVAATPPGTVLVLALPPEQVVQLPTLPPQLPSNTPSVESQMPLHPALGNTWPALNELLQDTITTPHLLGSLGTMLQQTLPIPNAQQFPAAALFFIALLRNNITPAWGGGGHDTAQIMTDMGDALPADKALLLSRVARDMATLSQSLNDPNVPGDAWRPLPMPLQMGDQLLRLQWFVRYQDEPRTQNNQDDQASEQHARKRRKTRFLLDVPQTGVGDIQIDGLVQPQKLDVILRTHDQLLPHQRVAIADRFQAALDITGFTGAVTFQPGAQNYVRV